MFSSFFPNINTFFGSASASNDLQRVEAYYTVDQNIDSGFCQKRVQS